MAVSAIPAAQSSKMMKRGTDLGAIGIKIP